MPPIRAGAAYGLLLSDLVDAAHLLRTPAGDEQPWRVDRRVDPAAAPIEGAEDVVGADRATHPLPEGGVARIDRPTARTTLTTPRPVADTEVVHPHLASTAVVTAHWRGQLALHAGAVLVDRSAAGPGVVALLGARDAGKSTSTWALAAAGCPVVTDDVLVLDPASGRVWPGPRCVDLRAGAAEHYGVGEALGVVGRRERWRAAPDAGGDLPAGLRLGAVVEPVWGDTGIEAVPPAERIALLTRALALRIPPADPTALLRLLPLTFLRWRRPRDFAALPGAVDVLLSALRGTAPPPVASRSPAAGRSATG